MKLFRLAMRVTLAVGLLGGASAGVHEAHAQGWGDVVGQFVLDGDAPKVTPKANDKEAVCSKEIPSDELHVNKDNRGIANVFIYIPATKKPKVHPDLAKPKDEPLVLDQKDCRFVPHAMIGRTGQTLLIKSMDNCNHNTRITPVKGTAINSTLTANNRDGIPYKIAVAETLPTQIKCDIHPWMTSWCLMLDHPYAAASDADGKFKIEKVPAGDHEFRVWHEFGGGFYVERALKVSVKDGKTTDIGAYKITAKKLAEAAAAK